MLVFNATMGAFYFGYVYSIINTSADKLSAHFQWKGDEKDKIISIITSLTPTAALFGALIAAPIAKIGRRKAMIIADIIGIIGLLVCLYSIYIKSLYTLFIGRVICGLIVGCNSALTPLYIKEISPVTMSGITGTYN